MHMVCLLLVQYMDISSARPIGILSCVHAFSCVTTSAAGCLLWVFWFTFVKKRPKSQLFFQVSIILVVCMKFYWSKPHLVCSAVMVA